MNLPSIEWVTYYPRIFLSKTGNGYIARFYSSSASSTWDTTLPPPLAPKSILHIYAPTNWDKARALKFCLFIYHRVTSHSCDNVSGLPLLDSTTHLHASGGRHIANFQIVTLLSPSKSIYPCSSSSNTSSCSCPTPHWFRTYRVNYRSSSKHFLSGQRGWHPNQQMSLWIPPPPIEIKKQYQRNCAECTRSHWRCVFISPSDLECTRCCWQSRSMFRFLETKIRFRKETKIRFHRIVGNGFRFLRIRSYLCTSGSFRKSGSKIAIRK